MPIIGYDDSGWPIYEEHGTGSNDDRDRLNNPTPPPTPAPTPAPPPDTSSNSGGGSGRMSLDDAQSWVSGEAAKYGISAGETDAANLAGKNPADIAQFQSDLVEQFKRRAAPLPGSDTNIPGSGSTPPPQGPPTQGPTSFVNTHPTFTDPNARLIEDYALDRFRSLLNPPQDSGTALFEQYAKELIETLKQPVYSPEDEAVLKGRALDSIETERGATKQRWVEEMSRRGISPQSGLYLDGLLKIDNHFATARTVFEREFAAGAIDQTRQQRFQVLNTLGTLAGSEEARLTNALTYATIPKQLSDNAFQQGLQLVGAGGNPTSLLSSALAIAGRVANNAQLTAANRSYTNQAVYGTIGELLETMFGGR